MRLFAAQLGILFPLVFQSSMTDPRRYLGTGAVLSLVLLRMVIGWHFFTQGLEKVRYDSHRGQLAIDFTAEEFLRKAKGPLAELYRQFAPSGHDWTAHLAVPRENMPPSADDAAERARWAADYNRRRAAATKNKTATPVEFPPFAPYHDWAAQIEADWDAVLAKVREIPGLTDEQKQAAADAFAKRRAQLADYLAGESEGMTEYQHQLWRLADWQSQPEAKGVPYHQERIAAKDAETSRSPQPWVSQIESFDRLLMSDLWAVLTPEQQASASTAGAMTDAQMLPSDKRFHWTNVGVTWLTIGVGVCLLLGFFTRLASIVGALFLLSVVASQPPWLPSAAPTIMQSIEMVALLVLAATGAGRWLGLDYFTYAPFGRREHEEA
jgi:uncharacterized membrane protein YphA (DoxX/SURF4 family)